MLFHRYNKLQLLLRIAKNYTSDRSICEERLIFRQLFDNNSSTYTYLLGDVKAKEAVLIDPVLEHANRDFQLCQDLNLCVKYALNTHVHADHITGSGVLKKLSGCKSIISRCSKAQADISVDESDIITFGEYILKILATPGHTNGCVTYYLPEYGMAFTGDTLLIRGCGRTDFQEGSSKKLYTSVHEKIFTLPLSTKLYPAHDYNGRTVTTVDEEKRLNPRLTKTLEEFIEIMDNLQLPYPKMIDKAVPANKMCGVFEPPETVKGFARQLQQTPPTRGISSEPLSKVQRMEGDSNDVKLCVFRSVEPPNEDFTKENNVWSALETIFDEQNLA